MPRRHLSAFTLLVAAVVIVRPLALAGSRQAASHADSSAHARASGASTALDRYVAAPDPAFAWRVVRSLPAVMGVTTTLIDMTSQAWLTESEVEQPLWRHWLTVVRPQNVTSDVALLFITGGR